MLQPGSPDSCVLTGAFHSMFDFITRAKGQPSALSQGAEAANTVLEKWSCSHCWGWSSDLNRYRRVSPQELPCLALCGARWEKRAQAPNELWSRVSRDTNLYGSLELFTFGFSPGGGSDKPSVAQQYPALPRSGSYLALPSPCSLCSALSKCFF